MAHLYNMYDEHMNIISVLNDMIHTKDSFKTYDYFTMH